ncbi:MAG TPA: serine protease, partial [Sulfurovum sp.]|nr:serine protease [Sulfurovum sp.]
NSSLSGLVNAGDILTAVDGHNIEDDGTVEFRKHEYSYFHYFIDQYQMGESVIFDIMRDQKPLKVKALLKHTADDMYLVKTTRYDVMPTYFVYGGYVFSPLTRNLILSTNKNRLKLSYLASKWQEADKSEVVVLLKVLASDMSRGDNDFGMWPIDKVNGQTFKNFKEFYEKVNAVTDNYLVLEDKEGVKVIIDRDEAQEKQSTILKKYNIEFDKSIELRD